jgi:hypothetical protein
MQHAPQNHAIMVCPCLVSDVEKEERKMVKASLNE